MVLPVYRDRSHIRSLSGGFQQVAAANGLEKSRRTPATRLAWNLSVFPFAMKNMPGGFGSVALQQAVDAGIYLDFFLCVLHSPEPAKPMAREKQNKINLLPFLSYIPHYVSPLAVVSVRLAVFSRAKTPSLCRDSRAQSSTLTFEDGGEAVFFGRNKDNEESAVRRLNFKRNCIELSICFQCFTAPWCQLAGSWRGWPEPV